MMSRQEIIEAAQRLHRLTPEEIEAYELTPIPPEEEVRAYVDDYARRIGALFADIERWLAEDGRYTARRTGTSLIFEPLMAYYDLPDREAPVLSVFAADGTEVLRFRPNGLWVAPTKGRIAVDIGGVEIRKADRSRILRLVQRQLIDVRLIAQSYPPNAPDWSIYGVERRIPNATPFDRSGLIRLLEVAHEAL